MTELNISKRESSRVNTFRSSNQNDDEQIQNHAIILVTPKKKNHKKKRKRSSKRISSSNSDQIKKLNLNENSRTNSFAESINNNQNSENTEIEDQFHKRKDIEQTYKKDLVSIPEAPNLEKLKKSNLYEFYINNSQLNITELFFKNNHISTTKYNIFTFLPKALLYQFMRFANVYFVFIAIIQSIPIISPLGPMSAILPLIFVLAVSLIREGIEDCQRAKLDKEQNSDLIITYRNNHWEKIPSGELEMGEIVKVKNEGIFPADLLLLDSNLKDGICFIETGTLDGEKTLKIKFAPSFSRGKFIKNYDCCNNLLTKKNTDFVQINNKCEDENFKKIPFQNIKNNNKVLYNKNKECDIIHEEENLQKSFNENVDKIFIEGTIQCDNPNPSLYMLNGKTNMRINGIGCEFGLDAKNLLLKGARLKNTDWIIGIVIYTGHNCKIMKNAKDSIVKMSSVEKLLNKLLILILIVQIILSILSAIFHSIYFKKDKKIIIQNNIISKEELKYNNKIYNGFIDFMENNIIIDSILSFFTYILLLNTLIPVSLIITLELVKIVQGLFISADCEAYSFYRKKFITTNSVSLNEELGMVDYIFSDKTGTLTCNKMNLKFCVIGSQCFEFIRKGIKSDEIEINKNLREKENIIPFENYDMLKTSSIMNTNLLGKKNNENENNLLPCIKYQNYNVSVTSKEDQNKKNIGLYLDSTEKIIEEYWKALALCHDCNIQNGEYIGMSPDNLELVKSAKLQGFKFDISESSDKFLLTFIQNDDEKNIIEKRRFENKCKIEFSSDRKRESVLIKEGSLNKLYIKGADSIIEQRLSNDTPNYILEKSRYFVNLFSAQGYRTLYIAMKILSEEECDDFISEKEEIEKDTIHKKERLEKLYNNLENNLILLGSTIVEDTLQENVPLVIKELRQSDIKIWMLTGDKLSTAYNIGLSCNLINKNIKTYFIEGINSIKDNNMNIINKQEQENVIIDFVKKYKYDIGNYENAYMKKNIFKFGILIDEKALYTITENEQISKMFLSVAKDAVAVICCRVSPLQKSQVVKLMKNYDKSKITLAIGDGGNDVSMIMEAHIGIGIYGEEGLRAAQSSDYAIGEFQVLKRLLFFHGYLNLYRNSMMVIYFFYKNFVFTIIHFFYGFYNDFSGQTIIDDWFITVYNILFTSIPLAVRGILDIHAKSSDGKITNLLMPFLYKEQRENPIFNLKKICLNLLKGIIHSLIDYFLTLFIIYKEIHKDGYESNLWVISVCLYTNILLIVTSNIIIFTKYHTIVNWIVIILLTFILYIVFLLCVQKFSIFNSVGTMQVTFNSTLIWMNFIIVTGFCFVIDYSILIYNILFQNSILNQVTLIKNKNDISIEHINSLQEPIKSLLLEKLSQNNNDENVSVEVEEKNTSKKEVKFNINENGNETDNKNENLQNQLIRKKIKTMHKKIKKKKKMIKVTSKEELNVNVGDLNNNNNNNDEVISKKEEEKEEIPNHIKLDNNNGGENDIFKKNISKPFENNGIKFAKSKNRINGRNYNISSDFDTFRQSKQSDRNLLNNY